MREAVQLAEMAAAMKVAFDKKELPALGPGRDVLHDVEARYLSDRDGRGVQILKGLCCDFHVFADSQLADTGKRGSKTRFDGV